MTRPIVDCRICVGNMNSLSLKPNEEWVKIGEHVYRRTMEKKEFLVEINGNGGWTKEEALTPEDALSARLERWNKSAAFNNARVIPMDDVIVFVPTAPAFKRTRE